MGLLDYAQQLLARRRGQAPPTPTPSPSGVRPGVATQWGGAPPTPALDQTMLPQEGRKITLESGAVITMTPDGFIWSEENRESPIGKANPQTMMVEPNWWVTREQAQKKGWDKVLNITPFGGPGKPATPEQVGKTAEVLTYPFAAMGMPLWELGKATPSEAWLEKMDEHPAFQGIVSPEAWRAYKEAVKGRPEREYRLDEEIPLKEYLVGGKRYEEYRALPFLEQIGYEAPGLLALSLLPSATAMRAALEPAAAAGRVPAAMAQAALLPAAGVETATGAIIKYGIAVPLKYGIKGFTKAGTKAFETALDTGLDRWLAAQGRMDPRYRGKFSNFVVKDHDWLVERATKNMLKRQAEAKAGKMTAKAAQKAAAEDTVKEVSERFLLTSGRQEAIAPARPPIEANVRAVQKPFKNLAEFEQEIKTKPWAVITAANPKGVSLPQTDNYTRLVELREYLTTRGYNPIPTIGRYGGLEGEPGFFVRGMDEEEAMAIAKGWSAQESALVPGKLQYTSGAHQRAPVEKLDISQTQTANFTEMVVGGKVIRWSVPLEGRAITASREVAAKAFEESGAFFPDNIIAAAEKAQPPATAERVTELVDTLLDYYTLASGKMTDAEVKAFAEHLAPRVEEHIGRLQEAAKVPKSKLARQSGELADKLSGYLEGLKKAKRADQAIALDQIMSTAHRVEMTSLPQIFGIPKEVAASVGLGVNQELPRIMDALAEGKVVAPKAEPKVLMVDLQPTAEAIEIATRPDWARTAANLPGLRSLTELLSSGTAAQTPEAKALFGWVIAKDEGTTKTNVIMSLLHQLGTQEQVFGKLTEGNVLAAGPLKGLDVNSICEYPERYAGKLTPAQKAWIRQADEIELAKLAFLKRNNVDINELVMEEGGHFVGRRYFERVVEGEVLDVGAVSVGPARPGGKLGMQKGRTFKTPKEALDAGYRALPRDETLALNIQGAYNSVAAHQMADWLLKEVPWRTTGAPEELVLAAEAARRQLHRSKQLLAALNRAVRGERVPDATINSIKASYPEQAAELKALIPRLQEKAPKTAADVQSLTKEAKALVDKNIIRRNEAVSARARARERAIAPRAGEAMVGAPVFSGKVFTGSEAATLAETLSKGLKVEPSKVLSEVNKVNAIGRYFMLAGDASPLSIQLIFLPGSQPKIFAGTAKAFVQSLLDTKFHAGYVARNKTLLDKHPGYVSTRQGTEFTDVFAKGGLFRVDKVIPRDEKFLKTLGLLPVRAFGKLGQLVLSPFQRGFEGCLDYAGIEMLKAHDYLATSPEATAAVDQHVNVARGLTSSARLGVNLKWRQFETATILAARYNRSVISILFDFFQGNLRGKLARDYLLKGAAGIILASIAFSFAKGEDVEEIIDHLNICSPNFLTWDFYGTRIGPGSKVRSILRLIGQISNDPENMALWGMDNPAFRFARGNFSPVAGASVDLLTGKDYIGDPTRDNFSSFFEKIIASNLLPIWVQAAALEGGNLQQKSILGSTEFLGGRAYPESEWDILRHMRDKYAQADYKVDYEDLNRGNIQELLRKHPDLAEAEELADTNRAERGTDLEKWYFETKEFLVKQRNDNLEFAAKALLDKKISRYDYDNQRKYIRPYYSGGMAVLWSARESLDAQSVRRIEKWVSENQKQEDKDLADYQEYYSKLIRESELPTDWDEIDKKLAQRVASYSRYSQQYVNYMKDAWIRDLPPAARQIEEMRLNSIEDETWWDDYRGKAGAAKATTTTKPPTPSGISDYVNQIIAGR